MKRHFVSIVLCFAVFVAPEIAFYRPAAAQTQPLNVVATTTILADVAKNVGGSLVNVTPLVPANADVHAFQPSPEDVLSVSQANMLLVVGAGYEQFFRQLVENAAPANVVTASNGVTIWPLVAGGLAAAPLGVLGTDAICGDQPANATPQTDQAQITCDPHVWTDPNNVMIWTDNIAKAFAAADPTHAAQYQANADAYKQQLQALDGQVGDILSVLPPERRVLVTNHEFLSYFARAYSFKVVGVVVPGGSTEGEPDPQQLTGLISAVAQLHVPAIFAEVSANTQLAQTVADETGATLVTTLSESLTGADGPADTYLKYEIYNAQTIADALKEQKN